MSDPSEGQPSPHPDHHHHHHHHHHLQQHQEQAGEQQQDQEGVGHQHTNTQEQSEQQQSHHHHRPRETSADLDHSSHIEGRSDDNHQEQTALWGVPDQLAKILEAARGATNNVKSHAGGTHAQPTEEEQRSMYEQARQVFAQMPHLPNHDATAHALSQYSSRSTEEGGHIANSSQEGQGVTSEPEHGPGIALADHQDGQSSPRVRRTSSDVPQQQYTPHHPKTASAAAIAAMGDPSVQDHEGDVAGLSEHTRGYGTPEHRSIRSHTDELADESNAHASGSLARARGKKGKAIPIGGLEAPETERQRKDLHKEVERKRRAGINSAIGELQSLVPDCNDKGVNKGDIILRAAAYIRELKNSEASNIEKWTLEKLLMDQALHDGQIQLEATRAEVERLRHALGKEADSIPGTEELVRDWTSHDHQPVPPEQHQSQRHAEQGSHVEHGEQQAPSIGLMAHHDGGDSSSSTAPDTATAAESATREGDVATGGETVRAGLLDDVDAVRLAAAVATVRPAENDTEPISADVPPTIEEKHLRTQSSPLRKGGPHITSDGIGRSLIEQGALDVREHILGHSAGKRDHDDGGVVGQNAKVQKTSHNYNGEETKPAA